MAAKELLCLGAAMRLHKADDDVKPFRLQLSGRIQHGIGFANPRGHPQEDFQLAALLASFFFLDGREQAIGVRSVVAHNLF